MNILFDGRAFQFQRAGGINRYFAEIISGLPLDWVPVVTGVTDFGENAPQNSQLQLVNPPDFRPRRLRARFHNRWWRPRLANSVQLLHPTYYDLTCGFQWSDFTCPVVTTVYDMIYALFPRQMNNPQIVAAQRAAVLRADRVVCISRSTEQDLLELIPEAKGKTSVIPLASSFPILRDTQEATDWEDIRFLFVGGRGGYKNFLFLLRAFTRAARSLPQIRLSVAGAPFDLEERWQMYSLGICDKVTSEPYPNETRLQELYRTSVALLYPSRYEGFGIPPLEAMACGTVAVTGNSSSLPEVVGDAGIMLDPSDEEAWADVILKLTASRSERAALVARGYNRVAQFTWAACAQEHVNLYRALVAS